MITLPHPVSKKVGSTNLFRMFLYNKNKHLMHSFDRLYAKYPTFDFKCDSKRFQHAYSLEDVACKHCGATTLHVAYETVTEGANIIGLGTPRIACGLCKDVFIDPQDLETICTKHKDSTKVKHYLNYFLIGNNNKELALIMTLMAADLEPDTWCSTQYFQAFNSEETSAKRALEFLASNRKLTKPKRQEAKTLDISLFNHRNNLFKITDIGRSYYQKWLSNSEFRAHLPQFIEYRNAEIFEIVNIAIAKKEYQIRESKFKKPIEDIRLKEFAKHVPTATVQDVWAKDYELFWDWYKSLK